MSEQLNTLNGRLAVIEFSDIYILPYNLTREKCPNIINSCIIISSSFSSITNNQ